jgi:hypothetical protein
MGLKAKPSASGFRKVCDGAAAAIRLSPTADKAYSAVLNGTDLNSVKQKTQLGRYFREFCDNHRPRLSEEKFKKEGNFPDGKGQTVAVWTFKPWQWRLYGSYAGNWVMTE